jgi:hypothetical protein
MPCQFRPLTNTVENTPDPLTVKVLDLLVWKLEEEQLVQDHTCKRADLIQCSCDPKGSSLHSPSDQRSPSLPRSRSRPC